MPQYRLGELFCGPSHCRESQMQVHQFQEARANQICEYLCRSHFAHLLSWLYKYCVHKLHKYLGRNQLPTHGQYESLAGYDLVPHLYKFEEYGVPQARHRIIIIGIRKGENVVYRVRRCQSQCRPVLSDQGVYKFDLSSHQLH